jgi:hypothetical protein
MGKKYSPEPNSIKLSTNYPWVKVIQDFSKRARLFSKGR